MTSSNGSAAKVYLIAYLTLPLIDLTPFSMHIWFKYTNIRISNETNAKSSILYLKKVTVQNNKGRNNNKKLVTVSPVKGLGYHLSTGCSNDHFSPILRIGAKYTLLDINTVSSIMMKYSESNSNARNQDYHSHKKGNTLQRYAFLQMCFYIISPLYWFKKTMLSSSLEL